MPSAATENAVPLNNFVNIRKLVLLLLIGLLGIGTQEQGEEQRQIKMTFFSTARMWKGRP